MDENPKFKMVALADDPASHILAEGETVCGKSTSKTVGLTTPLSEIMESLDRQDYGWHWCPRCLTFMTGIPEETFTAWRRL